MRESQVEKYLVEQVALAGGITRKIAYIGRRGCPDRLVGFRNGRTALVELKRPLGSARAEQEREHVRLRAVGFTVVVLDTVEAVDAWVSGMLAGG